MFSELFYRIFLFALSFSVAISILVFPSLKKVSWKPIVALLIISRALDLGITLVIFQSVGSAEGELNPIIFKLYSWLGYNNLFIFLFILVGIAMALGFAWMVKRLIGCKGELPNFIGYHFGYTLIIGSFFAFINNCIVFASLV